MAQRRNARNALGRGLGALITPAERPPTPQAGVAAGEPLQIDVDRIVPNPQQPRRRFDPEGLVALAASIREQGVIEPVIVRRSGADFELVVGERRWRAAKEAGLATVPALVKDVMPRHSLEVALVENVQRQDLNPVELALAFQALADGGLTHEEIGQRVSLERSTVTNHLRLLELPRELHEDLEEGRLSMGHAKALLQVSHPERRRHLRDRIVKGRLSVRETENLARSLAGPVRRSRRRVPESDPALQPVVDALREHCRTRVRIRGSTARGRIEIEYFGAEDLDRIARALLGR